MADSSISSLSGVQQNQLGGIYFSGKPTPNEVRRQVVELARRGVRPCDISRQLRITHGCVSKLLSKFKMTGSVEHGGRHVGRPRVISRCMARKIEQYKQEKPQMFSWEIRDRLLQESECTDEQLPSLSSINRLVRHRIRRKNEERTRQQRCGKNSFMMASILDLPSKDSDESGKTDSASFGVESSKPPTTRHVIQREAHQVIDAANEKTQIQRRKNRHPSVAETRR